MPVWAGYAVKPNNQLFSKRFEPDSFSISKGITLSRLEDEAYGDELLLFLSEFFGCDTRTITSGTRNRCVFAGNMTHVQIAFKAFNYFSAFLSDELQQTIERCHKNTKPKNRRDKGAWHANQLLYKMFDFDDESFKNYSDEEEKALTDYCSKKVGRYYDENEPIGGWYQPPKRKKQMIFFYGNANK